MQVRVLGCSGAIAKDCRTTSFLVDSQTLIDAGTGVGDLTLEEMQAVDDVFLTHSHLDHIAALPLMLDAVASRRTAPLRLHALDDTLAALQQHIFNGVIWPDFSRIPSPSNPFVKYCPLKVGERLSVAGVDIEVLPARHTVPAVGYAARGANGWWVFSGDTGGDCPEFWDRVNQLPLAALVIETAFSNRESTLARNAQHLSPMTLAGELAHLSAKGCPIYITHTKPSESELIMRECREWDDAGTVPGAHMGHDIQWLYAGDVLTI